MPMLSKIYSASSKLSVPVSLASSKTEKPQYHLKNLLLLDIVGHNSSVLDLDRTIEEVTIR